MGCTPVAPPSGSATGLGLGTKCAATKHVHTKEITVDLVHAMFQKVHVMQKHTCKRHRSKQRSFVKVNATTVFQVWQNRMLVCYCFPET